jgi:DNA-binding Lrp family transcriptional regulator
MTFALQRSVRTKMAPSNSIPITRPMASRRLSSLDRIDVKILATLQRHGCSTNDKLARAVGLSPRACLERVRELEAAGIITGYQAIIDITKVSRPINVFAEITLERQANQNRFERRLPGHRRGGRVLGG